MINCEARLNYAEAQRQSWVKDCRHDVRFFLARQKRDPLPDEVFVECGDDYNSLPFKVREVSRWALMQGVYDLMLKMDDDMMLFPSRMPPVKGDYAGFRPNPGRENYCAGPAYWLGRKAMQVIATSQPPAGPAEDRWTGAVLQAHGIFSEESRGIHLIGKRRPMPVNAREIINRSYAVGEFRPHEFKEMYRWW